MVAESSNRKGKSTLMEKNVKYGGSLKPNTPFESGKNKAEMLSRIRNNDDFMR